MLEAPFPTSQYLTELSLNLLVRGVWTEPAIRGFSLRNYARPSWVMHRQDALLAALDVSAVESGRQVGPARRNSSRALGHRDDRGQG